MQNCHHNMDIIQPVKAIPTSRLGGNISIAVAPFDTKQQRAVTLLEKQMIH